MMKNNKGMTMMSLVVVFVVLLILSSVGVTAVYTGIMEVRDNKLNTELGMVRQAITEQYILAEAAGKLRKTANEPEVSFWVGERIKKKKEEDPILPVILPVSYVPEDENAFVFLSNLRNNNPVYQEDFYYRLYKEDLAKIGVGKNGEIVTDSTYTYVVNYKTGEVYNESRMVYSTEKLIYLPATFYNNNSEENDDISFNDWR